MNIIKLKDVIRPGDDIYNTYLKGKYAYWIQMRYIIPFESVPDTSTYISYEQDTSLFTKYDKNKKKVPYYDTHTDPDIIAWIDADGTEQVNSITRLLFANSCAADSDLTLDQLKKFRSWLPKKLLIYDQNSEGVQTYTIYSKELTETLQYYANGMTDYAANRIAGMESNLMYIDKMIMETQAGCDCRPAAMPQFYAERGGVLNQYNEYNKKVLIANLGQVEFWTQFPTEFLDLVRRYLSGIRRAQLHLGSNYRENLEEIGCRVYSNLSEQTEEYAGSVILDNLIEAFGYLVDQNIDGHRNQIIKALNSWLTNVYELMIWS